MTAAVLLLTTALVAAPAARDVTPNDDWPQWRGPNRDGKSLDAGITRPWPAGGPKLAWQLKSLETVGAGYGSPAVVGDRLYLVGREDEKPDAKEFCACLSLADGKQIWKTPLESGRGAFGGSDRGSGPHCTPTVDGDYLYVLGVLGDVVCFATTDGKLVWHKNLVKDFGGKIPMWGYSESVLIDGDHLVCTPGTGTGMVALNKKTGETVWQCKEFKDGAGHASAVRAVVGNVPVYVQQTGSAAVVVRAKDGKLLWRGGQIGRRTAVIPTPVVADGYAFFTAGYGAGCECYKLEPAGDEVKVTEVYTRYKSLVNHHGGVISVGDHVYGFDDTSRAWVCFAFKEAKDEPTWSSNKLGKGSITYADGHFYCYAENDGTLARIKATDAGWEEAGRFKIPATSTTRPRSGKVWPHPVIAQGKLFLRDYEHLYCYDLKGQ